MKIAYLGSKPLGLAILKALRGATPQTNWRVIHPDDASDRRSCIGDFREYAVQQELELVVASNQAMANDRLTEFEPDIVFVCGWYWLISEKMLETARHGFWGVHNSLLPKYRGSSPLVWAILNGDDVVGSTAFRFTPGMDDGPILYQARVHLGPEGTIKDALEAIEADLLANLPGRWKAAIDGTAELVTQKEADATYCGRRIPEDGRIDWKCSAREIHNFIRAQTDPYPGAFTHVGEKKVHVLGSELRNERWDGTPGQVLQRTAHGVLIACGRSTAIRITRTAVDGAPCEPRQVFGSFSVRLT
jgi:methionyl-tRNA formyltransferase